MTPPRVDTTSVSKDNFAVDRELGEQIKTAFPAIVTVALQQRAFLVRVVGYLAGTAGPPPTTRTRWRSGSPRTPAIAA
jgi:S-adenosyl methyltransferase